MVWSSAGVVGVESPVVESGSPGDDGAGDDGAADDESSEAPQPTPSMATTVMTASEVFFRFIPIRRRPTIGSSHERA
ncbi:MAG: hypothetical protein ABJ314_12775 [Ilumatobacter sp.]|uniref:hypothetical protein n=1 Tax=Ilumatobacter sp. TaxID=1967498 RepID=UPI003296E1FD